MLDFRISGLNEDHLRRWPSRSLHHPVPALFVKLILVIVFFG
jgi:hypothetical protein